MFESLIKENGKVDARELYKFLGVTERYNKWITNRITKYEWKEGIDFTSVKSFTVVNNGARKEIDNHELSINMAKELSMIQNNKRGREVRNYFIQCEQVAKELLEQQNKQLSDVINNETLTSREAREISAMVKAKGDFSKNPTECSNKIKKLIFNTYKVKAYSDLKRQDIRSIKKLIRNYKIKDKKKTIFDLI